MRGRAAERLAARVLSAQGYVIERTNVRYPVGEIDLVAREGRVLCFVEVRSASADRWSGALASVDGRKQRRLIRAARWHLSRLRELPPEIRFDVVAVTWHGASDPDVELVRGAFHVED
jgi:putative endonuclease